MKINCLQTYLKEFFQIQECTVKETNNHLHEVQLTKQMDQALMNRPFYWHYMNSIGRKGQPLTLTFTTEQKSIENNVEFIHYGSPRLQQIINYIHHHSKYTYLFEQVTVDEQTPLYPWLVLNVKISYNGRQVMEEIFSLGVNLMNGQMVTNMMEHLDSLKLDLQIPDFCYPITPILKVTNGFNKVKNIIMQYVERQDNHWVKSAWDAIEEEIALLKHFHQGETNEYENHFEKDKIDIQKRYTPYTEIEYINGGLIYLRNTIKNTSNSH
ncbi:MAG TPA: YqhG family protein [Virgibacillus sp.]|nr:YqhG family protein [Virgibacillus sp.]